MAAGDERLAAGQAHVGAELGRHDLTRAAGTRNDRDGSVAGRLEQPVALVLGDRAADDDQVGLNAFTKAHAGPRRPAARGS